MARLGVTQAVYEATDGNERLLVSHLNATGNTVQPKPVAAMHTLHFLLNSVLLGWVPWEPDHLSVVAEVYISTQWPNMQDWSA